MEFRLIYQGPLPAEKCRDKGDGTGGAIGRAKEKQKLRKYLHPQLRELWKQHPNLRDQLNNKYVVQKTPSNMASYPGPNVEQVIAAEMFLPTVPPTAKTWIEHIANDFQRCGTRFVPLIREKGAFTCALDILFLRRDNPGNLVENGGDIDNRIKVLFDGLRMPKDINEMGGLAIESDENPFFCLLEDDRLVTSISVTTDRLIVPPKFHEAINDVILVIHVTMVNPSAVFAGGRLL